VPRRERPLAPGDDVVVLFAADLRGLRAEAGTPTYRELSTRAGYSAAALSDAASGRKLPGLALTSAYVAACGGDLAAWDTRWREAAAALAAADGDGQPDPTTSEAPYLGLAPFQTSDAGRFFGREKLVAEVAGKLVDRRFVGVFGASGSGKSSLLRAGLAARNDQHRTMLFTPGEHPLDRCASGLAAHGQLLVIDQFEEVFTLCRDEDERVRFVDALLALAKDEHGTQVVIGVRADFYGHCGRYPGLVEALRDAQVMVGPMTADELRTAIVEPAVRLGCRVEAALVTTLVADATGQAGVLPLVSHALLETWRRRQGITLSKSAYEAVGGIQNAIAHTAEAAYTALAPLRQTLVRQIFLRLTALGDGTEDTKRRLNRRELDDDPETEAVLQALAGARLLVLDHEGVEIAHEALIRSWPRLRDWLADDREGRRIHRQLTEATDLWDALDRDGGSLYRGLQLGRAADWAARARESMTSREQEFLDASLRAEATETSAVRRRTRRLRRLVALLGVLLVLAGVTTGYAINSQRTATSERNVALARKVVGDAASLRAADPALSVQLSLAAYRLAPVQEVRDGLLAAMTTPFATRLDLSPGAASLDGGVTLSRDGRLLVTAAEGGIVQLFSLADPRHPEHLATIPAAEHVQNPLALSPDGHLLVTGTPEHGSRLWDVRDPRHPVARGRIAPHETLKVYTAQISPDGNLLVVGSSDGTARLTDISDPDHPAPLAQVGGPGELGSTAFSPDGRLLATGTNGPTVVLWDLTDRHVPKWLSSVVGSTDLVTSPVFSPDSHTLAVGGWDGTVRLLDVTEPRAPRPLGTLRATSIIWTVAFSPDGRTLVSAGDDQRARVWDIGVPSEPHELYQLTGHTNAVNWVGFTPDGRTILTAGAGTVRMHDVAEWALPAIGGAEAEFTPDGRGLFTTGNGPQLWTFDGVSPPRQASKLTGLSGNATASAISADGRTLAVATLTAVLGTGELKRWDITDPAHPRLTAVTGVRPLYALAFSPDGRTLAAGYDDGPTQLWDVSDPNRFADPVTFQRESGTVWGLRYTPDGRTLITARGSATAAVTLWDVADPRAPRLTATLREGTGTYGPISLTRDGRYLAAGSTDGKVYLWDLTDRAHPALMSVPAGHADRVSSVAFSPTGDRLVTGSVDHTALLWDTSDLHHPVVTTEFTGMPAAVDLVAFSPDGHTVATSSTTIRLWETDTDRVARKICALATPRITPAQWDRYFPGLPYQPPC
jgi:WD40 repeat protein